MEGILIFQNPTLRDMFDIKIFVETDADERILRRALRDVEERGRSMQSIVQQYLTTVKPMHEQFVEPTRKYADIVVLEGGHNLWPWISLCSALPATLRKIRRRMQHERRQAPSALLGGAVHRFGSVLPAALGHRCAPYRDVFPAAVLGVLAWMLLRPQKLKMLLTGKGRILWRSLLALFAAACCAWP